MTNLPDIPKLDEILNDIWDKGYQCHKLTLITRNRIDEREFRQMAGDDAKTALAQLLREARIDEVEKCKNRKQIFDYYDERIAELKKQGDH